MNDMKITINIKFNNESDSCRHSSRICREIDKYDETAMLDLFKDVMKLAKMNDENLCLLTHELDPILDYTYHDNPEGKTIGIKLRECFQDTRELYLDNDNKCYITEDEYKDEPEDEDDEESI